MPASAPSPVLFLISAPSGAGKTTLCQNLLQTCPNLRRAITCTTRARRDGERDGVDYYFLDPSVFRERVEAGWFLEHATVYGHRYGTLRTEVLEKLEAGFDVLINVDVQGAASLRAAAREHPVLRQALVTVFLTPPTMAVLERRLRHRASDSEAVIARRLAVARQEAERWRDFDYLLLSGTPEEDTRQALMILQAEQLRTHRSVPPVL
ncbi:MAG: guanylate kinase [Verrucomicrobia bacterium]|jgi:guanylate kinase|nr:guanylate kinase [Verrucomicrobiota bacterium]